MAPEGPVAAATNTLAKNFFSRSSCHVHHTCNHIMNLIWTRDSPSLLHVTLSLLRSRFRKILFYRFRKISFYLCRILGANVDEPCERATLKILACCVYPVLLDEYQCNGWIVDEEPRSHAFPWLLEELLLSLQRCHFLLDIEQ